MRVPEYMGCRTIRYMPVVINPDFDMLGTTPIFRNENKMNNMPIKERIMPTILIKLFSRNETFVKKGEMNNGNTNKRT